MDSSRSVSVIVPTYCEAENLPHLIEGIEEVKNQHGLTLELLIMDDNSPDGTPEVVERLGKEWVTLHVRTKDRGLSQAVCDGLDRASNDALVVMDGDLSHPPSTIVPMMEALEAGAEFVLGSRYVRGGTTSDNWGFLRWLNSKVATLMALPFTTVKDPMSGFFAIDRSTYEKAEELSPIGYKIGLEILVKCGCELVKEIPIHFENRKFGESKLTFSEQLKYIVHVRRLFIHKYGTWSHLIQFLIVGGLGMIVNLVALTLLIMLGTPTKIAVALGIFIAMIFNFALNRRFTFSYARSGSIIRQLFGFIAACSFGALVNYLVAIQLLETITNINPQIAAVFGIIAGSGVNFLSNRFAVFKRQHYREG